MRLVLLLMKNALTPLANIVLLPLEVTAAASATDASIQKKIYESGMTTLIISNKEMKDIMKIVKSLEESGLLMKSISETIKNEAKEQKGELLSFLLGTLGTSLLGSMLSGKKVIQIGEEKVRAGQGFKCYLTF